MNQQNYEHKETYPNQDPLPEGKQWDKIGQQGKSNRVEKNDDGGSNIFQEVQENACKGKQRKTFVCSGS